MGKPSEEQALSAIETILEYVGANIADAEFTNTPRNFLSYLKNAFRGYGEMPEEILSFSVDNTSVRYDDFVLLDNIWFHSTSVYDFLPITGYVSIAYFPSDRMFGMSKVTKLVEAFALRFQTQENLTIQIGRALDFALRNSEGVAVSMSACHHSSILSDSKSRHVATSTFYFSGKMKEQIHQSRFLRLLLNKSKVD